MARDARDDGGAVLVLALLVITTIALVATAVLVRGNGALRTGVVLRDVAASTYQADAAGDIVVNNLRTGYQDTAGGGASLPGNNPADPSTPWRFTNALSDGCFGQEATPGPNGSTVFAKDGTLTLTNAAAKWRAYVVCKGELGTGSQGSHTLVTTRNRPKFAVAALKPQFGSVPDNASLDLRSTYGVGAYCKALAAPAKPKLRMPSGRTALSTTTATTQIQTSASFGYQLRVGTELVLTSGNNTQTFVLSANAASTDTTFSVTSQIANFGYTASTDVSYVQVPLYLQGDLGSVGNLCNEGPLRLRGGSVYAGQCFTGGGNTITLDSGVLAANTCGNGGSTVTDPNYKSLLEVDDRDNAITPTLPTVRTIPAATDTAALNAGGFLNAGTAVASTSQNAYKDCRSVTTKQVFTLKPGSYLSVAGLNGLTSRSNCVVWFMPGVYYFDFRDANTTADPHYIPLKSGQPGAVGWRIEAGVVIGGGKTAPVPTANHITDYGSCPGPQEATIDTSSSAKMQADADAAAAAGVQFIFGGQSQMELATDYGSAIGSGPQVDLCGRYSLQHPPIVIYGNKVGAGDTTGGSSTAPLTLSTVNAPTTASPSQITNATVSSGGGSVSGSGSTARTWTLPSSGTATKTFTVTLGSFTPSATVPAGSKLISATINATYGYRNAGNFAQPTINLTPAGGSAIGAVTLPANSSGNGGASVRSAVLSARSTDTGGVAAFNALKTAIANNGFTGATAQYVQTTTGNGTSNTSTFAGAQVVLTLAKDTGSPATTATSATSSTWTTGPGATASWSSTSNSSRTATVNLAGFSSTPPAGAIVTGATVSVLHRESNNGSGSPNISLSVGSNAIFSSEDLSANTSATPAVSSYTLSTSEAADLASAVLADGNYNGLTLGYTQSLSGGSTGTPVTADVAGASIAFSYTLPGLRPLTLGSSGTFWHDMNECNCNDNPTESSILLIDQRGTNGLVQDHNFQGSAYFEGTIYAPQADARIGLPNANNDQGRLDINVAQSFAGWGIVIRSAFIERPYTATNQANGAPYLGTPWLSTGAGQDSTTAQFQVFLCTDMTSTCNATSNSRLALQARVQLLDEDRDTTRRSVSVLSWSHQR